MNAEETSRRLAEAESNVARTLLRLQQIRRAILNGEFDPQAYDAALVAYRQAEFEAYGARQAWARARAGHLAEPAPAIDPLTPAIDPLTPAAEPEPFQPTERMRFVRWLVQQGRLSEWDVD